MPLSQALQTYFRVGEIDQVEVNGLEGCCFLDTLTGKLEIKGTAIRIDREIDRI